jgi:hypothetical protein
MSDTHILFSVAVLAVAACSDPGGVPVDPLGPPAGSSSVGGSASPSGGTSSSTTAGSSSGGTSSVGTGGVMSGVAGSAPQGGSSGSAGQGALGGSSPAGGSAGGGSGDPLASGGPSKCMVAGNMLCDGFEGPAPGAAGSQFKFEMGTGSTGVVDTTKPFRGMNSVHIKTNGGQGFITETSTFTGTTAATNNAQWGRIWIWFETKAAPNSHDVFIRLEDTASSAESAQLHVAGGSRGQLASEIRSGSDLYHPKIIDPAPKPLPDGTVGFPLAQPKWQCWEWHTTADNTLEFFIDGTEYTKMKVVAADKWPFPIFKKLYLGFMQFGTNATPVTELWIDEVAVSSSQVGCGN